MASAQPGHPLIQAWRAELSAVFNETGPGKVPKEYIRRAFIDFPDLLERWNKPNPPPLPYLWVYLALQVVLQKQPKLSSTINLLQSSNGPMFRRYLLNIEYGITDNNDLSQQTADHLASQPLDLHNHDRWFIKLVGKDREPCQAYLDTKSFESGSALDILSRIPPRSIIYGQDLHMAVLRKKRFLFRASVQAIVAAHHMMHMASTKDAEDTKVQLLNPWNFQTLSTELVPI